MKRQFQVTVFLKEGLADPQGKAIEEAAPTMGWRGVSNVRVGKTITFTVEAETAEAARTIAGEMAERLLSNPVIEESWLTDLETGG
ncbi:MAG TPA: phosphoribosylformylglycinamidine synthase subunit PurS [Actinomycetota bacterium]|nr:phosphoribosylformylglycinamidine synthase subunit PurS [Actinomycetota bacterium]